MTFVGAAGKDTLIGGGGEYFTFFLGSAGNDVYGFGSQYSSGLMDYSSAPKGVHVDLTFRDSHTYIDDSGLPTTVAVLGRARDGFGGTDLFLRGEEPDGWGFGMYAIIGSPHRDVMRAASRFDVFYGAGGDDHLIGGTAYGGPGDDRLTAIDTAAFNFVAYGEEGDDFLRGSDRSDFLYGGIENDRILAGGGNDGWVLGEAGNDFIDGGEGNDFIDGGVGADVLVSGAGNDTLNTDIEFFQLDPNQPRDGARDVIRVTVDDLGDFTDVVLSRSFEAGTDEIRFREAARAGFDCRVFQEAQTINPATGRTYRGDDLAELQNTVLQVDWNGDGFGDAAPDAADYFLVVLDAALTEHGRFLLT